MTNSSKRKAARAADFQKKKLKLGKGKQAANNATDTSFKAKTVALPQQSINLDRTRALTTRKGQTLNDLCVSTRHHNAGVRKDSLLGEVELIQTFPHLATTSSSLSILVPSLLHLLSDEDSQVRQTLRKLLSELLERNRMLCESNSPHGRTAHQPNALQPYMSQLLLYITSAMSHIFAEVRLDAVLALSILIDEGGEAARETVVQGWSRIHATAAAATASTLVVGEETGNSGRILRCLVNLLGLTLPTTKNGSTSATPAPANSSSSNSMSLSKQARFNVLSCLAKFLRIVQLNTSAGNLHLLHTGIAPLFADSFGSPSDFDAFQAALDPAHARTQYTAQHVISARSSPDATYQLFATLPEGGPMPLTGSFDLQQIVASAAASASSSTPATAAGSESYKASPSVEEHLWRFLSPTLTSLFYESIPDAVAEMNNLALATSAPGGGRQAYASLGLPARIACMVVEIMHCLVSRFVDQSSPKSIATKQGRSNATLNSLEQILSRASIHFPFGSEALENGAFNAGARAELKRYNLAYCEVATRYAAWRKQPSAEGTEGGTTSRRKKDLAAAAVTVAWVKRIREYLEVLLGEESTAAAAGLIPATTADAANDGLASILPTIWLLLNDDSMHSSPAAAAPLLRLLLSVLKDPRAKSSARADAFSFLAHLSLVSP